MKPTMQSIDNAGDARPSQRSFPLTDYIYQSVALGGHSGHCAKQGTPSFHTISRDYFKGEANQYFLAEAFVFAVIMATVALPLISGAHAVLSLVRSVGGV